MTVTGMPKMVPTMLPTAVTLPRSCSGADSVPLVPARDTLQATSGEVTTALHWLLSRELSTPDGRLKTDQPMMMVKAPELSVVALATTVLPHTACTLASGRTDTTERITA